MTTRNFRVKNGISVGDIVIDATNNTLTGLSTSAPSADGDVATKKYVDDSVSGFSGTTITDGNSSVVVADSGTGTITVTADGGSVASFAAANTTITASNNINLTATGDVVIPADVGITFGTGEKIEGDNTDLTITSGGDIALTATGDVNIPANVGVTFGDDGEKIEGNGTNLTISSSGELTMTATGTTTVTNNFDVGGNMIISGDLTVNGTETIVATQNLNIEDSIIGLNSGVSDPNNMPRFSGLHLHRGNSSVATEVDLYMVWDDATNATGSTTNLGGVFTFMGSVHEAGSETPNSGSFILADIKASTIEANLTGDVTGNADTATEATNVTVTANNSTNETVYLTFVDGATGTQGIETDTGLTYNPSTNVLTTTASAAQYSDIAERFEADTVMEYGAVVTLGGEKEITEVEQELSDRVFGVISHKPGYMMNSAAGDNSTHPFVAMAGRTPVKVIGTVNKGDRLVSSSIKGTARAVAQGEHINPFHVIGRALESKTDTGLGMVNCVVRTNN